MHHKKSFSKSKVKKDGPLTWDSLNDDLIEGFDSQVNNEMPRQTFQRHSKMNTFLEKKNQNAHTYNTYNSNRDQVVSDNQRSPTFKPVGPHLDSTVNNQGQKYSNIIRNTNKRRVVPGYYGRSRLTRI